jgi:hypothetical protein
VSVVGLVADDEGDVAEVLLVAHGEHLRAQVLRRRKKHNNR